MGKRPVTVRFLLSGALALLFLLLTVRTASADSAGLPSVPLVATEEAARPVVRFYLFYSDTCPHCHEVMEEYLPAVYEKYGDRVEYEYINIHNNTDNYVAMLGLEMKLGLPEEELGFVPALVIGDKVLIGRLDIADKLEGYIDGYLAEGGIDFPSLDDLPPVVLPTPTPTIQFLVIFDPESTGFADLNSFIMSLMQEYGASLQPLAVDMTEGDNIDKVAQLNDALGAGEPAHDTPEILIDRQLLVGMSEIEQHLPDLIDRFLTEGGVGLPLLEELLEGGPSETPTPEPEGTTPLPELIYMAYFEQAGCQECARTTYDLSVVQEQYPQVVVESFSMEEPENKALNEWLSEKYGVPEEKRLSSPMVFVGEDVLIDTEANLGNLMAIVGKYAQTGAPRIWDDFDPEGAEQNLVDRFQSFGLLTVMGAGLIDGLNPCAFATLVFFISYLAFTGRRGRDILLVGFAFALGVFLTYLLVGVGLLRVVQSLGFFTALGRWVYLLTALLCIVLAILTLRDFLRARQGRATEMTLKLPMGLRRRINKVIRENAQTRAFVVMALVTGFVVSLIELACTGQVYLPTIVYVMSVPEMAARAFFYLALYCLMFIVPLIVVFVLSYFGTTSDQLGEFVNRHTGTIKFITGLVFIGLALWMTWTLGPLFGINGPWSWALMGGVVITIVLGVVVLQLLERRAPEKPVARRRRSRA